MFKNTTVTLNNGDSIDITSINNGSRIYFKDIFGNDAYINMPYQVTWYYNEIGNTVPPTVIDLSKYAISIGATASRSTVRSMISKLEEHVSEQEVESPEYLALKQMFNASVYWLWGDLDSGGVFLYKTDDYSPSNPYVYMGGVEGYYEEKVIDPSSLTEQYYYYYNFMSWTAGNKTFTFDSKIVFFWNAERDNNNLCVLYDIPTDSTIGNDQWQYCVATKNDPPNVYDKWSDEVQQASIIDQIESAEFTQMYQWRVLIPDSDFDFHADIPKMIIRTYAGEYSHNTVIDLGISIPSDTKISGDMLGSEFSNSDPMPISYYGDGGGFGTYPTDNAMIGDTDESQFTIDAINSGFVTLYKPTKASVVALNDFLFSDSITEEIANKLKQLIANPLDYILFIAQCHFTPITSSSEEIKYCGLSTGVYAEKISKQFQKIDCGWVNVVEPSRTFLDYTPNTKIKIYLPYIGVHELNVDDCMSGRVHVTYWIDLLTGSCIAQVRCQRSARVKTDVTINDVLYEFTGNCYVTLPLTSTDWRGTFNSMLQFIGGVAGIAGGAVAGSPQGLVAGAGQIASSLMSQKVGVNRTGQAGTSYGYMGHQRPYLIYERPIPNIPNNFKDKKGYVSNIPTLLERVTGYTEIDSGTLQASKFTKAKAEEVEKIKELVEGGIIL